MNVRSLLFGIPCLKSCTAGWCLNEQAIFEKWLERAKQRGALFEKLAAETVLDAAEGDVQVRDDELVRAAADDRDEAGETALASDGGALVAESEVTADLSVATGKGDEGEAGGIKEENSIDLEAVSFFKQNILVGAAGEKRLKLAEAGGDGGGFWAAGLQLDNAELEPLQVATHDDLADFLDGLRRIEGGKSGGHNFSHGRNGRLFHCLMRAKV